MLVCENCGKPATLYRDDRPNCDTCIPGDWTGAARPLVLTLPDLSGRVTLSRAEAANALGVSVDTLDKRVIPELRTITKGGRVLIPVDALREWAASSSARALK